MSGFTNPIGEQLAMRLCTSVNARPERLCNDRVWQPIAAAARGDMLHLVWLEIQGLVYFPAQRRLNAGVQRLLRAEACWKI